MEDRYQNRPRLTLRTLFNLSVIVFILLVGFSVFYYLVIFLPSKEESKVKLQKQLMEDADLTSNRNKSLLQQCLNEVSQRFTTALKDNKTPISNETAKIILDESNKQKNECFKRYPQ